MHKQKSRPPRTTDFPSGFVVTVRKRFGSWDAYVGRAIGNEGEAQRYKFWENDEQVLSLLKTFYADNKRFPILDDLQALKRGLSSIILRKFGSINAALERAVGTSPRILILRAIEELTPPGCDRASSTEILALIRTTMPFPTNLLSFNSRQMAEDGLIVNGEFSRTHYSYLTAKGRTFLKETPHGKH